ncbi:MAG: ABC transporter permease [Candidatus Symbiothrix sp.]|jgi:putative ABC transport system permease protein|nr:ABC transporter permease [Candidatus Symbiothrix sp.]
MKWFDSDRFEEIWVTITRNKVRSLLTGFGVFWGIFMLVVLMGFGEGLNKSVTEQIEGFAINSCFVMPGRTSEPYKGFQAGRRWRMHNSDVELLRKSIPEIEHLSPVLYANSPENNVVFENNAGTYSVRGLHDNYQFIESPFLTQGRFINKTDVLLRRKVCVIGTKVFEALFPRKQTPIGEYIQVDGIYYQVIGVSGGNESMSINGSTTETVSVPYTTLQQISNQVDEVDYLTATVKKGASSKEMEEKIKTLLKEHNNIAPTDMQAVRSFNLEEQFKMFDYLLIGIMLLIWIVGSGTLIAGVVGVSNIMLVTVKERTKEIGVKRAIGARPLTIAVQILSESLLLTVLAGILGLVLGVFILHVMDVAWLSELENTFVEHPMVSFKTAIVSMTILIVCGLIAGAIPTIRALKIKAIDAIREE